MSEPSYRVTTLGCRVNRADSLDIERRLSVRGYRRAGPGEVPDVWVVNTCAVTAEGMRKSRKAVRRCAASGARVLVTGCGVDMDASSLDVEGVDSLFGNAAKPTMVEAACRTEGVAGPWHPEDLARVPVKVQEGCSRYCAYCVVPLLRPPPSSRPAAEVVAEVEALASGGAGEVILCGIDLGSYRDPETGARLAGLIASLGAAARDIWLRLSSIEVTDVDDGLLEHMAEGGLCRHLHLPLQSGDRRVLRAMGREYTPLEYSSSVARFKDAVPGLSVTSDVMVGFPAEDGEAFDNTAGMVSGLGFARLHVFKYSPREGTRAFELGDPVPPREKEARALRLRAMARDNASEYHAALVGRIIPVLVESPIQSEPGMMFGRTEGFAGAVFEGREGLVGRRVMLRVASAEPEFVRGVVLEGEPPPL